MVAVACSLSVARFPHLATFLRCPIERAEQWRLKRSVQSGPSVVLAWGERPSSRRAVRFAQGQGLPLWRLEDGFLCSLCLGAASVALSLVVDDLGIYYQAARPSRLEALIGEAVGEVEKLRAEALVTRWREARVSKYNHAAEWSEPLPLPYVLVVDQTAGDLSISGGLASAESFNLMLEAALDEHPEATILVKTHPEVFSGRKAGCLDLKRWRDSPRVKVLPYDVHPVSLLQEARAVYVVTSQLGFEALLWGKPVRTFGMPFYAGWGLTEDHLPAPERRGSATLDQLVHAALIRYPRYIDPERSVSCEAESAIDWMGLQRKGRERFPAVLHAPGFSFWKRRFLRHYFPGTRLVFSNTTPPARSTVLVWGNRRPRFPHGGDIIRIEDGLLRSKGLGSELVAPRSLLVDRQGIHYDASKPSDLETLLATTHFDEALTRRAASLVQALVCGRVSKYNLPFRPWSPAAGFSTDHAGKARRIVLVIGQVEGDASLQYGSPGLQSNRTFLRRVREGNPGAWVVYKPHPDVVAGLRPGGASRQELGKWCDEMAPDASLDDLFRFADEIHVLTSLTGFEALLRGGKVVCHGVPFYAGWGLTSDVIPIPRRQRHLSLEELVAGALILYPLYLGNAGLTTPERVMELLAEEGPPSFYQRCLRGALQLLLSFGG
ncbi:MAG TPA: hypothetical protein VNQ90_20100 [Chthoniobacteraceae bacterium]|nr:hypothetical protein [Chthoniobacteraceae bacterium]